MRTIQRGVFRALRFLVCITLLLAVMPKAGAQEVTVWNGEDIDTDWYNDADNEFILYTAEQLAGLAELVNGDNTFEGKTVRLGADIVLNNTWNWKSWSESSSPINSWTVIGKSLSSFFSGTFDGQGHVVRGIYISNDKNFQGLFGYIKGGTVKNVGVEESFIKGKDYVAAIAGQISSSSVSNCYNTGTVLAQLSKLGSYVGGIVGYNENSSVSDCYNVGKVSVSTSPAEGLASIGGIVGYNENSLVSNYYYLKGCADKGNGNKDDQENVTASKDENAFENGEVAYLLQEGQMSPAWGQVIGFDGLPTLGGPKVVENGPGGYKNELPFDDKANVYLINTADELRIFSNLVNSGESFSGETVKLTNDIELNDTKDWKDWDEKTTGLNMWTAIGAYSNPFCGTFDGQGYVVRGIYISNDQNYQGLFGYIRDGMVMNVGVEESFIRGSGYVGGIAGYVYVSVYVSVSLFSNCYKTVAV